MSARSLTRVIAAALTIALLPACDQTPGESHAKTAAPAARPGDPQTAPLSSPAPALVTAADVEDADDGTYRRQIGR
ncbi:MAG TPA: hypothetical protein VED01_07285 [Burkholderiales bacterium]|nr:hypothetical protein [Burkholderiales bacterium]